ncbi:epoxide hydrolase family protein [Microbacterium sp. 10M-3C3]|jgi:pimeloyl-ACP methyl ester carboxylesterase|uniref:epoxide hydrolase family protein n=1 Tax=Microbacterium sp. 10M-3C3 TaxID=2483401 RepID=UPI000F637680|nr:epoxide hydrolase family protein [Microbacterium sp. 10M-3C3]
MTASTRIILGDPHPWTPSTPPDDIADLRARVRRTRWPALADAPGWSEGTDSDVLRDLAERWGSAYDWTAREERIARHPWHEVAARRAADGGAVARIRFIHARATSPRAALLLCHGWPDSAWRYLEVVDALTSAGEDGVAFDVVVPEMPGFGYSTLEASPLNSMEVAELWAALMRRLGYDRYVVAGGDIGSAVGRFIALNHPAHVIAVHRMDAGIPVYTGDPAALSAAERAWMRRAAEWSAQEGAYAALHRTKPVTLGAALADSPVGLAAWIVEKLHAWSDRSEATTSALSADAMLDLVTTTWLTNSATPAMRMYRANAAIPAWEHARRVEVPSGFSLFPGDLLTPPPEWLDRVANVARVTRPERGGHFAPRETPELYVRELRAFFEPWVRAEGVPSNA